MQKWIFAACWLSLFAGCHHPFHVAATVKATAEMPPVSQAGPVRAMTVSGNCSKDAAKVAVVDIDGLLINADLTGLASLGENPVSLFRERLDAVAGDPCVRAVVLRINSAGGGVTATDVMWHELQAFKQRTCLPIVACLLDVGTGGAYYLATGADQIIAHPTTVTGGIGVILNVYNMEDAMAQFNIVGTPIKAGKNIDIGTPIIAIDAPRRALLQKMADGFHARFRQVVTEARPSADPLLDTNFDGRVFTADEALERQLIDSIGYMDDAIAAARGLAGCPQATVVLYHRTNDCARTAYSVTPNVPLQNTLIPASLPGLDRSRLPSFLYMWQPEPTMEKLSGR